jgi:hypothetical protein
VWPTALVVTFTDWPVLTLASCAAEIETVCVWLLSLLVAPLTPFAGGCARAAASSENVCECSESVLDVYVIWLPFFCGGAAGSPPLDSVALLLH